MEVETTQASEVRVIEPAKGWNPVDFKELHSYRDLFRFLVWRDIKVLYAQTVLGFAWAILNPVIQIVIFSIIFGKLAGLDTGAVDYVLFSTLGVVPWTYMSQAMTMSSQSLVAGQQMLGKIYFPRLIFPLTPIFAKLVDFGISLSVIVCVMLWFRVVPSWQLVYLPLFVLMMMMVPAGAGMWLSSLAVRFRDVKFAMHFVIGMLIYSAPILYPATRIYQPETEAWWTGIAQKVYPLNPIVAVVEGYRACFLGNPIPWEFVVPGMITNVLILVTGALYFRRMERVIVDVI